MLEVTPLAMSNLHEFLAQNKIESAIRVALMPGGCSGPALGLALDEAKENDQSLAREGVTFLIDKDLMELCEGIKIDFLDNGARSGFSLSSTNPVGGNGGGCGGSCGSGSCG